MTGDYTKVALRPEERWTGARMQQGRVLLDHDWNLNLDAGARAARAAAADIIGASGVVAGSPDFQVSVPAAGPIDLTVHAGHIWVDGLLALAPADFDYAGQPQILPPSPTGTVLVFLDVFEEHVQPAEDLDELVDPALAPIDTTGRTRVGYRVRLQPTNAPTCKQAWDEIGPTLLSGSTGKLSIDRVASAGPADPCAPPGDPLGQLPDALLRVEVLDPGFAGAARFAWSYENGAAAVAVASSAGDTFTLVPSAGVGFATGELVEVSWLTRRADRVAHGPLYTISTVQTSAGGDVLTLTRPPGPTSGPPPLGAALVVRRFDGEVVGAASEQSLPLRGNDLGVRFTASAGLYQPGDWWGSRLREERGIGVEVRTNVAPDGIRHAFAPLALVDLGARKVLSDCRRTFVALTELEVGGGCCTVTAKPGDDLQAALDSVPETGGELCLAAGAYPLLKPLTIQQRTRIVVCGAGPATVLQAVGGETALLIDLSSAIEVRHMRVEGAAADGGETGLNGAITVTGSTEVTIADCSLACPASPGGDAQTCLTVRSGAEVDSTRIRIERNRLSVGQWESGILLVDVGQALVAGNEIALSTTPPGPDASRNVVARGVTLAVMEAIRPGDVAARVVDLPGGQSVRVRSGAAAEHFIVAIAQLVPASLVARRGIPRALRSTARRAVAPEILATLSDEAKALVSRIRGELRAAGAGIVVGGTRAGSLQIVDNVVDGAVQGIHVGLSNPKAVGQEAVGELLLSRNVVHALVPPLYERDRHAVFVGNARSVHIVDTRATLSRGNLRRGTQVTPVEAIRIHGELGPFLTVRQSSLRGFAIGVRVVPTGIIPDRRMWLVAETMAVGAPAALVAPATVDRERNVP